MSLSINTFVQALQQYEIRKNMSVTLVLESDGSGYLCYYSTGESFYEFDTPDDLFSFLKSKN